MTTEHERRPADPSAVLVGHLLIASAALTFALHAWPRVKPPGA